MMPNRLGAAAIAALLSLILIRPAVGADTLPRQYLAGQIPAVVRTLPAIGSLPATNQLRFVVTLPQGNQAGLDALLHELYTPGNPHYRQFLTPAQFADRFGAPVADYQALVSFLKQNGLTVTRTYADRTMVAVTAPVAAVEKAFQVHLRVYRHPTEPRIFYAPDADLSVAASLPVKILSVSGLDNYSLPRPVSLHARPVHPPGGAGPELTGSGPGGNYIGHDFRIAYLPSNRWNGTGQSVALVEFDGYYSNDITAYETAASLPPVSLANVPVNGGVSTPGSAVDEVSLDIEMVISMATNVSKVLVYEAPSDDASTWLTMLQQMADDNLAKQISSSWFLPTVGAYPAAEQIFQRLATQGQSFFQACGDYDAFNGPVPFPTDSPNITEVGGTLLTTLAGSGNRSAETVWNRGLDSTSGQYIGTGGGVSTSYSIPPWQQGINSILTNGGSTTFRNVPDVAMTAENVYVTYGNGSHGTFGGTS